MRTLSSDILEFVWDACRDRWTRSIIIGTHELDNFIDVLKNDARKHVIQVGKIVAWT